MYLKLEGTISSAKPWVTWIPTNIPKKDMPGGSGSYGVLKCTLWHANFFEVRGDFSVNLIHPVTKLL